MLIPTTATRWAFKGMRSLLQNIQEVQDDLHTSTRQLGIVITMYDKQLTSTKTWEEMMRPQLGDKLFPQKVPKTTRFEKAVDANKTILEYRPTGALAMMYREIAKEVVMRAVN